MNNFSKDILHTIEKQHIAPRPRWVFVMRQVALMGGLALSIIIGGVSVSIILFSLMDFDAGVGRMMRMHPGPFLLTYLPYVWVVILIVFGIIAYYDMRNIKGAYRYHATVLLGVSVLASVLLGSVLYVTGMGRIAERRFADVVPRYQGLDARKMNLWMRPHEGLLAGVIVSGSASSTIVLDDFSGTRWVVDCSGAVRRGSVVATPGEQVRFSGSITAPGTFQATDIFPWTKRGPGQGMMQGDAIPMGARDGFDGRAMMMRERNLQVVPY